MAFLEASSLLDTAAFPFISTHEEHLRELRVRTSEVFMLEM